MTVTLLRNDSPEFLRVLSTVQRELVTIERNPAGVFVKTPLNYPGGSAVVVQVGQADSHYFVSDFGMGCDEAEQWGISRASFARFAHPIAEATGTRFDNHSFFVMETQENQLAAAIVAVANASQAAVSHAAFKSADKTDQADGVLFARLELVFRGRNVTLIKRPKIQGFSSTPWSVDALVTARGQQSIFEAVANHPSSIASATMKFVDIGRLQDGPRRFSVVKSKKELGTYLGVLSQASNVIEETMSNENIASLALAA